MPRASSSLAAFWAVAGFAALLVGDAVVRGDLRLAVEWGAPAALAVWVAWLILYRPQVRFDQTGLVVLNPLRISTVPWTRVAAVTQRFQLVLELDDGSHITCWGSPFPEKPGLRRPNSAKSTDRAPLGAAAALEVMRSRAISSAVEPGVRRGWDLRAVAIGVALVAALLAELALVR